MIKKGWYLYASDNFAVELNITLTSGRTEKRTLGGNKENKKNDEGKTVYSDPDFLYNGIELNPGEVLKSVSVSRIKGKLIYIKKSEVTSKKKKDDRPVRTYSYYSNGDNYTYKDIKTYYFVSDKKNVVYPMKISGKWTPSAASSSSSSAGSSPGGTSSSSTGSSSGGTSSSSTQANGPVKYNGHYYYLYSDQLAYNDAAAACSNKGGYLVSITSSDESSFVNSLFKSDSDKGGDGAEGFWIGGYLSGSSWKWKSGESFSFNNWDSGQPDDSGEGIKVFADSLKWDDCGTDEHHVYICEWNTQPASY